MICHLSEKRSVEGDGVETVHRPHGDVQVHQQPLLLLRVHRCPDTLTGGRGGKQAHVLNRSQDFRTFEVNQTRPLAHLHRHDQAAGHVPHFSDHSVRSSAKFGDLLQLIGLHLEILLRKQQRSGQNAVIGQNLIWPITLSPDWPNTFSFMTTTWPRTSGAIYRTCNGTESFS